VPVKNIIVNPGKAAGELGRHILADITGKDICLPQNTEASTWGAAIAAAIGVGWQASFKEAANAMTGICKTIDPDLDNDRKYQERSPIYKKLYPCFKSAMNPDCLKSKKSP
jgi:sugar (pentulose or hexulose) kinase